MRKLLLLSAVAIVVMLSHPARAQFCPGVSPWVFDDVPAGDPFCGYITWMAQNGITLGCQVIDANHRLYCPTANVSRSQMAAFMNRLGNVRVEAVGTGPGLTGGPITSVGTISLAATNLLPTAPCTNNQIARWNGSAWVCSTDANSGGTVTSVATGAGLTGGPITTTGTVGLAATQLLPTVACSAGQVPQWSGSAWACAAAGGTGTVTSVGSGTGLSGGPITTSGALSIAASYQLPQSCTNGQVPKSNGAGGWTCASDAAGTGTVTSITAGNGLTGGTITVSGTIGVNTSVVQARVLGDCGLGTAIAAINPDGTVVCSATAFLNGGNAFGAETVVGTTDDFALDVRANSARVMRYEPNATSPNVIGGSPANNVSAGVRGATIGGGGAAVLDPELFVAAPNRVTDAYGTVGGGLGNVAGGDAGTVTDQPFATVGGGVSNTATGAYATVGGGSSNTASGGYATVGGGNHNDASGFASSVGAGWYNTASASYAAVGGGTGNNATGMYATAGGGQTNKATASHAAVGGGNDNLASGPSATVPGGRLNTASGAYSFAAGYRAKALADGVFILADSTNADFIGNTANVFAVAFTGGIGMWTSKTFTNGCSLAPGGGSWSCGSSRDSKQDFVPVDGRSVLDRVVALPISEWRYKTEVSGARHVGPMAQDFRAAFGLGDSERTIGVLDASGVALAAIQGLNAKVEAQAREIAELKRALETLLARIGPEGRVASR